MASHMPPVPPGNRSPKGTGDPKTPEQVQSSAVKGDKGSDQKGHQANIKQNTTNQGYQQDR